ncbi:MAG: hypothetical protein HYZ34_06100 [Ignavibacteriae bacterium]|nr:hypothetical protein [Ignavibacteriota bacterium]
MSLATAAPGLWELPYNLSNGVAEFSMGSGTMQRSPLSASMWLIEYNYF